MIMKNKIRKTFLRARDKGIREGIRYLRGQMYSTSSYDVLRHDMKSITKVVVMLPHLRVLEIHKSNPELIEEVFHKWPPEFGRCDQEYISRILQERFRNGAWCFACRDQNQLVAAFWLSPPSHWYANVKLPHLPGEYVIYNLFVAANYRGLGVSKLLLSYGLRVAHQRGVPSVLSAILADRTASLRAHLSVGFYIIGSFRQEMRWFHCRQFFLSVDDKEII